MLAWRLAIANIFHVPRLRCPCWPWAGQGWLTRSQVCGKRPTKEPPSIVPGAGLACLNPGSDSKYFACNSCVNSYAHLCSGLSRLIRSKKPSRGLRFLKLSELADFLFQRHICLTLDCSILAHQQPEESLIFNSRPAGLQAVVHLA